ncbi:unnamed protein product [Paramecium primaurelia]|uniref:Uncharacterized protein n=1 Tax=Paramecium primaurelia TaxID=5886 RepID=A0A8S1JZ51_PARPR|nr:unnamed protein product [Paramecium primaurelia]
MQGSRRHPELDNMPDFLFENTLILSDPREENCYSTIKDYCCPNFNLMSFTAIISLIQLSIFIVMCFLGDFNLQKTILCIVFKYYLLKSSQMKHLKLLEDVQLII